jgi:endonuclease I
MATSKKTSSSTKKKTSSQINVSRAMHRASKKKTSPLVTLLFLIVVVAFVVWYQQNQTEEPVYGAGQNEDGYYYYQNLSTGYYASAHLLVGDALKNELNVITNDGLTPQRYSDAKTVLAQADLSLTDRTKVYNIYNGLLVNATWDSTSWHREHVWPNSRLGMDRVDESGRNQASDLHNLRAITPAVNSSRSDRFYDDASGGPQTVTGGGYYPGDDHKGDVARILFYMYITYDFLMLTDDGLEDESNHYTLAGAKMGKLSLLLEWHREDPVDDFEKQRNDVIFQSQGNRNPFIDQPAYVHLIWEDKLVNELIEPESTMTYKPTSMLFQMIVERSVWHARFL